MFLSCFLYSLSDNTNHKLGHEIAGEAVAVGSQVPPSISLRGRYAVYGMQGCTYCANCLNGKQNICLNTLFSWYGLGFDGGYQPHVAIKAASLVPIPENVSYEAAAVTTDAVLTCYHAIKLVNAAATSKPLNASNKILIIGAGGLGINALQLAKVQGLYTVVVDIKQQLEEKVTKQYHADEFYNSLENQQLSAQHRGKFDAVFDLVGTQGTFEHALKFVRNGGTVVPIGISIRSVLFDLPTLAVREVKIQGALYGSVLELHECLELVSRGLVKPEYTKRKFNDLKQAMGELAKGKVDGRLVFNPSEED